MKSWMKRILYICNFIIYLVIVALWISIPEELTLNIACSVFNLAFTGMMIIWDRENLKGFYASSQFKGLTQASASAALVLAILGLVNYLSYKNPVSFDLSAFKTNTLTKESKEILRKIDIPITIKVFAHKNELGVIRALIDLYRYEKNDIAIELVDVELQPGLVAKYQIERSGTIIAESGERHQRTNELSELAITNAIVKLTRDSDPQIYYVTGHGEVSLGLKENRGGTFLKGLIQKSSFELKEVVLSSIKKIPKKVKTLIIWGPKTAFLKGELEVVEAYLQSGGRLLAAIDPNLNGESVTHFRHLLRKWGIKVENQLVVDRIKHVNGSDGTVPIINAFSPYHAITKGLKSQVFLPLTTAVNKAVIEEGDKFEMLASSSAFPASWGDTDPAEVVKGTLSFDPLKDLKGPIGLVAAITKKASKAKIV
ncbi:MAG: GldG family protein, partial [Halobacteriovoraceae bacterium]|nr:GldG family protein [Halobacteriovoraceae bacterium]